MDRLRVFVILTYCTALVVKNSAILWYKSDQIGSYSSTDVISMQTALSKVECAVHCSLDTNCTSIRYESPNQRCICLSVADQLGPSSNSTDIYHYSRNITLPLVCPIGYDLLPNSPACVKPFTDYLSWQASRTACQSEGADLPVLDTDYLFSDFIEYMDQFANSAIRVAVGGILDNNLPYWNTGGLIDPTKFCVNTPDFLNHSDICMFVAHKSESWCGSNITRLDDAHCNDDVLRICMIK